MSEELVCEQCGEEFAELYDNEICDGCAEIGALHNRISRLAAENAELRAKLAKAKEALVWYAQEPFVAPAPIGEKARTVLEEIG